MHGDDDATDAATDADSDAHAVDDDDAQPGGGEHANATGDDDGVDEEGEATSESVEGVDTEHVMNLTFVLTLLLGVPTVVVLSLFVPLSGWNEIIGFVVRVGAGIWFLTAVTLYVRERLKT